MSRASKILSLSPLDRFSYGDFFGPLNKVGEDKGLSFRFGGMKFFYLNFQRRPKLGARLKRVSLRRHASPSPSPAFEYANCFVAGVSLSETVLNDLITARLAVVGSWEELPNI